MNWNIFLSGNGGKEYGGVQAELHLEMLPSFCVPTQSNVLSQGCQAVWVSSMVMLWVLHKLGPKWVSQKGISWVLKLNCAPWAIQMAKLKMLMMEMC